MFQSIRLFLLSEAALFLFASLIHHGVLFHGYKHHEAGIAEGVIGLVLLAGLALTALRPASTRAFGLTSQAFAFLGTCVGIVMVAIGVGPRTGPDIALHVGMIILLIWGLIFTFRARLTPTN
jgi:hypothetical protein